MRLSLFFPDALSFSLSLLPFPGDKIIKSSRLTLELTRSVSVAATASPAPPMIKRGVAPLRAGQGTSFLLRRLHSLSGIVPIGAFLVEHFISNAFATRGPAAYAKQVEFLSSFP